MLYPGCLPLIFIFGSLILLPFFVAQLMVTTLTKLGLSPEFAILALLGIILGGALNIPIKRIPRESQFVVNYFNLFGIGQFFPRLQVVRNYTTLAVNVGGCLVPCAIAIYEFFRVVALGATATVIMGVITIFNVGLSYRLARPIPGVGIGLPALIPSLSAALPSIILIPNFAPPVAFVAGVLGPLIGADLLHLRDVRYLSTGMASIGGAGTFDGIVLSGLMAAFLA